MVRQRPEPIRKTEMHKFSFSLVIILLIACPLLAFPPKDIELKSTEVVFLWDSVDEATGYQFQIRNADDDVIIDSALSPTGLIIMDGLEFGQNYSWNVRAIFGNGDIDAPHINSTFGIIALPDSIVDFYDVEIHNADLLYPGYSVASTYGTVIGIDFEGNVKWYIPGRDDGWFWGIWDIRQYENGYFSAMDGRNARIFNVHNQTLFQMRDFRESNIHHALTLLPWGNFLGIEYEVQRMVIDGDTTYWQADYLIELDRQGQEVWRWSCWDNIPHEDYDRQLFSRVPPNGAFDWTHCNSCPFDPADSSIYLSVRNIHRIIKIDYPSGDIVWNMGAESPSGIVDFGQNLEFYRQHAPEVLENGSILLFDNHTVHGEAQDFSRAIEIEIDEDREIPAQIEWEYRHEFSATQGDADRLPNGNTLIPTGTSGSFYEVSPDGELLWEAHNDFRLGMYRGERIDGFYPQVFNISTPLSTIDADRGDVDVSFRIYNLGQKTQRYQYVLANESGFERFEGTTEDCTPQDSVDLTFTYDLADEPDQIIELEFTAFALTDTFDVKRKGIEVILGEPGSVPEEESNPPVALMDFQIVGTGSDRSIQLNLARQSEISGSMYNIQGRLVSSMPARVLASGRHFIDMNNHELPVGTYILRLKSDSEISLRSFQVVK